MPTILGPDGSPINLRRADLARAQSLRTGGDYYGRSPSIGLRPARMAQIMQGANKGNISELYALFEDLEEKDAHVSAEMNKRRRACLVDWSIEPPQDATPSEKAAAEVVGEIIAGMDDLEDSLYDLTDAIGKGFACLEIDWRKDGQYWAPARLDFFSQRHFAIKRDDRHRQTIEWKLQDGTSEPLQPFGWVVPVIKAKSGSIQRSALWRQLAWLTMFKTFSVGNFVEFLEAYGYPIRVGKYQDHSSTEERDSLLHALKRLGKETAGIINESMDLTLYDAVHGDGDAFLRLVRWCEANQSRAILGGTLTGGSDGQSSTYALGKIHNEVRQDLRDSDIRQLSEALTRDLVYAVAAVNGLAPDGPKRSPRWVMHAQDTEDINEFADGLQKMVGMGAQVSVAWAQERAGIPVPADGEDVLQAPERVMPLKARVGTFASQMPAATPERVAGMADRLVEDGAISEMMDTVRHAVNQATSMTDLRSKLAESYPDMGTGDMAEVLAQAMAVAHLAGRWQVLNDARR